MAETASEYLERSKMELARAYAVAVHGHSGVFLNGLLFGFDLTEEGKKTVYSQPRTPDEVTALIPKLELLEEQFRASLDAEAGGGATGNEEPAAAIAGFTVEESADIRWLSTAPVPGVLRPVEADATEWVTGPALTEEEQGERDLTRIKTLIAG